MLVQRLEIEKNQLLNELQQYRNNGRFEKQQLLKNQSEELDSKELIQIVDDYLNDKMNEVDFTSIVFILSDEIEISQYDIQNYEGTLQYQNEGVCD